MTYDICEECHTTIMVGDLTHFDNHLPDVADVRMRTVCEAIEETFPSGTFGFSSLGETEEHSVYACECCGTPLHGNRFTIYKD